MEYELFNIGITLYELFFNNLPFYKKSDEILYKNCVLRGKSLKEEGFDPKEYPLLLKKSIYEGLIITINERRNNWIKNLTKDDILKKQDFYNDKLFCDLLYKLIKYDTKESIKNYNDLYKHPFFSQYQY